MSSAKLQTDMQYKDQRHQMMFSNMWQTCKRYVKEVTRLTSTVSMTSWHLLLLTRARPVSTYCSKRPFRKARSASVRVTLCSGVDKLLASLPSQLL